MKKNNLLYNPEQAYMGQYSVEGTPLVPGTLIYKTYQTCYVESPYTDEWENAREYFKMNIKVPVAYDGKEYSAEAMAKAPILFFNPWNIDMGAPVAAPDTFDVNPFMVGNDMAHLALSKGWVVILPAMRGCNCTAGQPDTEAFHNFAKLPRPLADLKAAIRYLRYETNAALIPGDKERIFVSGFSSGGCATSILGASGNSPLFEEALKEIGAAPGRDDVFCAAPSCPVITRSWGDPALAWERWGDLEQDETADPVNRFLSHKFVDYQNNLGLKAAFTVPGVVEKGSLLTTENYKAYIMAYVKESALRHLNAIGNREEILAYVDSAKPGDPMYQTPDMSRAWIQPVFASDDSSQVVDIQGSWEEFFKYTLGEQQTNKSVMMNLQYDKPMIAPDECMEANGMANSGVGEGLFAPYANASSFSFGKSNDYASVFTKAGQDYIREVRNISISEEYMKLIEMQRNCVDPLYFIIGEGAENSTTCKHWHIRTGSVDVITPKPIFFNLATALQNQGNNVDVALVWEQTHGQTTDLESFFEFAESIMK